MLKGIIFDINGTTSDILTDEGCDDLYRVMSNFLDYFGMKVPPAAVKQLYFELLQRQKKLSDEAYPEFDAVELFREFIAMKSTSYTRHIPKAQLKVLPEMLALVFRAASRFRLQLYPGVRDTLELLRNRGLKLGAVSDGQSLWGLPEMHTLGLDEIFEAVIISSDEGFRKPDTRIFLSLLHKLRLKPDEAAVVGNDMFRDIAGAGALGMKSIFFHSNQGDRREAGYLPDYTVASFSQIPEALEFLYPDF